MESVGQTNTFLSCWEGIYEKNRNARKKLNDLYLYLDINSDFFYRNPPSESMKKRYEEIKEKMMKNLNLEYLENMNGTSIMDYLN